MRPISTDQSYENHPIIELDVACFLPLRLMDLALKRSATAMVDRNGKITLQTIVDTERLEYV